MSHIFIQDIKQIESSLATIFLKARAEWLEIKSRNSLRKMTKTCSATIMHQLLFNLAENEFRNSKVVRVDVYNQKPLMIFSADNTEYQISLKKIDENFETHNILTRQTSLFNSGDEIPGLLKGQTRLNFGYQIDSITFEPKMPSVTCYQTKQNYPIQLTKEVSLNNNSSTENDFIKPRVKAKSEESKPSANENLINLYDRK